jgi:hypothetical protein
MQQKALTITNKAKQGALTNTDKPQQWAPINTTKTQQGCQQAWIKQGDKVS